MNPQTIEQTAGTLMAIAVVSVLAWIALPEIAGALEAWAAVWEVAR